MGCFILLFIVILVVSKVTSSSCFDQRPPDSSSGDEVPEIQQVTTLQYCLIDNCTIMKIDTGEKLDIVYTIDSLLIATPTDGHTSVTIVKLDDELPCAVSNGKAITQSLLGLAIAFVLILLAIVLMNVFVIILWST